MIHSLPRKNKIKLGKVGGGGGGGGGVDDSCGRKGEPCKFTLVVVVGGRGGGTMYKMTACFILTTVLTFSCLI